MFSGEAMKTPSDSEPPGTLHLAAISTLERDSTVHHDVRRRRLRPGELASQLPELLQAVRIVVLFNQSQPLLRGEPMEILSDEETAWVAAKVAQALRRYALEVRLVPVEDDLDKVLANLNPQSHLIFNLYESLGGRSFSEVEAAENIAQLALDSQYDHHPIYNK
jgi:hypothetical protein